MNTPMGTSPHQIDYDHYSKLSTWSLYEALLLSLGLNPKEYPSEKDITDAIKRGLVPVSRENYAKRKELIINAYKAGDIDSSRAIHFNGRPLEESYYFIQKFRPEKFIYWASSKDVSIPPEFMTLKNAKAHINISKQPPQKIAKQSQKDKMECVKYVTRHWQENPTWKITQMAKHLAVNKIGNSQNYQPRTVNSWINSKAPKNQKLLPT